MSRVSGGRFLERCRLVLLAGALVTGIAPAAPASLQDLRQEARNGAGLTAVQAGMLEQRLSENPQNLVARAQLLGYYHARRRLSPRRHAEHVLWFIHNAPESEILNAGPARIIPMFNPDGYIEAKRAWQRLVDEEPDSVAILRHAARFYRSSDAVLAARVLRQAEALEPANPEWARELARLDWRESRVFPEGRDPVAAARALDDFERAYELSDARGRVELLPDLALAAFSGGEHGKARGYAKAMLEAASERRDRADSIHYGHLVLGQLALSVDDLDEARARLLAAGRVRGSRIERFGAPDMTLAKRLLERGASETVREYLELCFDFWHEGRERLEDWIVLVEAGRIPDFGPHLTH